MEISAGIFSVLGMAYTVVIVKDSTKLREARLAREAEKLKAIKDLAQQKDLDDLDHLRPMLTNPSMSVEEAIAQATPKKTGLIVRVTLKITSGQCLAVGNTATDKL